MFYDKFKQLCEYRGISCNKAASEIGLSNATPTKWKKTGAMPDSKTLAKISAYFGISIGELLTNESTGAIEFTVPTEELRDYLQNKKRPTPVSESGQPVNIVKIAGRDGRYMEKRLTDEQIKALQTIIDQMPEANDL